MTRIRYEAGSVYFAGPNSIGLPKEARVLEAREDGKFPEPGSIAGDDVVIGRGVYVGSGVTIYEGTKIGPGVVLEDHVRVGYGCSIAAGVRVMYGAFVCDRVKVGRNSRIAGFLCDAARVGEACTVMGDLVHKYVVADLSWGDVDEPAPEIEDGAIVGYGAKIVGGVKVGCRAFVATGAVVTRDVAPETVVTEFNRHCPAALWRGADLRSYFARSGMRGDGHA